MSMSFHQLEMRASLLTFHGCCRCRHVAPGVVSRMMSLKFLLEMECPVRLKIATAPERSQTQHRFSPCQAPACTHHFHAILHQMATRPFDHPGRDRKAGGQRRVVVQKVGILAQIMRALLHRGTLRLRQASLCRTASEACGYLAAASTQEVLEPRRHPGRSRQWCPRMEGFGRFPHILQDMD